MLITCLHTTKENISIFEAARPEGVSLIHHVRSDLLRRAMNRSDTTVLEETHLHLRKLNRGSDAVLLTSSTLSKAAEPPSFTTDNILFSNVEKLASGKTIEILYANEALTEHMHELFRPLEEKCTLTITLLEGAWDLYQAGKIAQFQTLIDDHISQSQAELIVLGHSAMAGAGQGVKRVISSPDLALQAIKKARSPN